MKSLAICLFALSVVGVNSHYFTLNSRRLGYPSRYRLNYHYPHQIYPNTGNGKVELVEGTIDQLNNVDAKWVCTNQKTGDMMVIGTENGNTLNNLFPPRNQQRPWQQPNVNPQQPQQPNVNPQQPQQQNFNPQQPQQQNFNPQQPQQQNFNPQQPQQQNFNPQQPQQQNFNPQQPQQQNFNPQQPQQPQQQNFNPQQPQQQNFNPQQPQQPVNPPQQPQQPTQPEQPKNPGFVEVPWTAFPTQTPAPSGSIQGTTKDPLQEFDWASYVSTTPSARLEYDGTGVIEPRVGL